jgi:hypothetical protein
MLKDGYEKVIYPFLIFPLYQADDPPAFRRDQVYSKSPAFGDGGYSLPDLG